MSLDDAVARFISAVSEYFSAKKNLEEELLKIGVSKRTAHVFVKNLEDSVRLNKKGPVEHIEGEEPKKADAPKATGPKDGEAAGAGEAKETVPAQKAKKGKKVDLWALKDKLEEGEVRIINDRVYYKLNGKVKAGKNVPLWTFRQIRTFFNPLTGNYFMKSLGVRGSAHHVNESVVIAQARTIVQELNAGEVGAGDLEVYEPLVRFCLPKMRPLAREAIKLLLDEYTHWMGKSEEERGGRE